MRIPRHVAIIPDGNRRWAVREGKKKEEGYRDGIGPGLESLVPIAANSISGLVRTIKIKLAQISNMRLRQMLDR